MTPEEAWDQEAQDEVLVLRSLLDAGGRKILVFVVAAGATDAQGRTHVAVLRDVSPGITQDAARAFIAGLKRETERIAKLAKIDPAEIGWDAP